ncbi:25941_t:CDS:1, partial [Racocetra persica]
AIKTNLNLDKPDNIVFWTIATTVFYGLACLGELLLSIQQDQSKVPTLKTQRFEKTNYHTFATI